VKRLWWLTTKEKIHWDVDGTDTSIKGVITVSDGERQLGRVDKRGKRKRRMIGGIVMGWRKQKKTSCKGGKKPLTKIRE